MLLFQLVIRIYDLTWPLLSDNYSYMNKKQEASNNIANRLTWHSASRDQAGIAKELAEGKDIPEVYGLGEAGLFDEFFYFRIVSGLPLCSPGLSQRQKKGPVPIRGPVSCDFIRDTLMSIAASTLEKMFNRGISILAEHKFFPKTIHALLDASQIESTEKCKGCGKVTKDKPPELRLRKKRIRRVLETVFGFTDGIFLWWLNTENITFFIPAKANMNVYQDALFCIGTGNLCNRDKIRTIGAGKNKIAVTDHWSVESLENLTTAEFLFLTFRLWPAWQWQPSKLQNLCFKSY